MASRADPAPAPPDGATPAAAPDLDGWEHVALTAGLARLWWLDGPWAEAITRHTAAIQAAGISVTAPMRPAP
jgi:hypothetical protein